MVTKEKTMEDRLREISDVLGYKRDKKI